MSPGARLQAARSACFVGPDCLGFEAVALLDAARDEQERTALRDAARERLCSEYASLVSAKTKNKVTVELTGEAKSTLSVSGACSRFIIEDFLGGPERKQAQALGLSRIECADSASKAGADL
jgi:hypothetical protein